MNILKLFKGAKFDYDQRKECYHELKFSNFLFLTTLIIKKGYIFLKQTVYLTEVANVIEFRECLCAKLISGNSKRGEQMSYDDLPACYSSIFAIPEGSKN